MTTEFLRDWVDAARRAFTFIEIMIVVVVLGVLAAMIVPQFGGVTGDAKASALKASLGGVRSGIAGFRARQVIAGADPFPTLAQLTATGTVVQSEFPANPFNNAAAVQQVTKVQADARAVLNEQAFGWNYYVDNSASPPVAVFYANSNEPTTTTDGQGGFLTANRH